jgi:hypothetical protein
MGILCRVSAAFAAVFTMVSRAMAAEPFGEPGQLVIDQSFMLAASRTSYAADSGLAGYQSNQVTLAPVVSWFAARRVSLRLGTSFLHSWASSEDGSWGSATRVGVSPGIGYALPLGRQLSLWPRLSTEVGKTWYDALGAANAVDMSTSALAPVLWHPAEHFFIGLGPGISWRWQGERFAKLKYSSHHFLLMSTLGGYFSP